MEKEDEKKESGEKEKEIEDLLEIREQVHANIWYTSQKKELEIQINCWLESVKIEIKPPPNFIKALIVPHSGFAFSGFTASWAYKYVKPQENLKIFIFGPCHYLYLRSCGLTNLKSYQSPIKNIEIDQEGKKKLKTIYHFLVINELHEKTYFENVDKDADEEEHSIEMQLPFISKLFKDYKIKIIPVLVGSLDPKMEADYGAIFAEYFDEKNTLFIFSSDLTHWGSKWNFVYQDKNEEEIFETIEKLDRKFMDVMESQNLQNYHKYFEEIDSPICGKNVLGIFLNILNRSKNSKSFITKFVKYSQSFPITDKKDTAIGYGSGITYLSE